MSLSHLSQSHIRSQQIIWKIYWKTKTVCFCYCNMGPWNVHPKAYSFLCFVSVHRSTRFGKLCSSTQLNCVNNFLFTVKFNTYIELLVINIVAYCFGAYKHIYSILFTSLMMTVPWMLLTFRRNSFVNFYENDILFSRVNVEILPKKKIWMVRWLKWNGTQTHFNLFR